MTSHSPLETKKIAEEFVNGLTSHPKNTGATVLCLYGDLGSGKTTFTQCVASKLGIGDHVVSPTFVIIKTYNLPQTTHSTSGFKKLIHIDAYRLDGEEGMEKLGWKEIIENPENLVVIEWPQRIEKILPREYTRINFTFIDDVTREITFS